MSYPALDVTTTDSYQALECPNCSRLVVQISNAAVLINFGHGSPPQWEPNDEPYLPVVGAITRDFDAFRVKSKTKGVPAQATLTPIV